MIRSPGAGVGGAGAPAAVMGPVTSAALAKCQTTVPAVAPAGHVQSVKPANVRSSLRNEPDPGSSMTSEVSGPLELLRAERLTSKVPPAGTSSGVILLPASTRTSSGPIWSAAEAFLLTGAWPGTVTVAPTVLFTVAPVATSGAPLVRLSARCATSTHCAEAAPFGSMCAPATVLE